MRYMLLVYGCYRPEPGTRESDERLAEIRAFAQHLVDDGVFLAADPLHTVDTATTVRVRDGEALVTDGPFAETAEQLGGYFVLDCTDLDQALKYAALCPMAREGSVEVRPILETALPGRTG
jgi:hypothetical protein